MSYIDDMALPVYVTRLSFTNKDKQSPIVHYNGNRSLNSVYFLTRLMKPGRPCNIKPIRISEAEEVWKILQHLKLTYDKLTMDYLVEEDYYHICISVNNKTSQEVILIVDGPKGFELDCQEKIPLLEKLIKSTPSNRLGYSYHYDVPIKELFSLTGIIGSIIVVRMDHR